MDFVFTELFYIGSFTTIFLLLSIIYYIEKPHIKNIEKIIPVVVKYEDKYMDKFKKLANDLDSFTEEELEEERGLFNYLKDKYQQILTQDIKNIEDEILVVENQIKEYKEDNDLSNEDFFKLVEEFKNKDDTDDISEDLYELIVTKDALDIKLRELENTVLKEDDIQKEVREKTICTRRDKLMNSYIIENTPLGHVAMRYNNSRGTFEYYADNTIPYRFLEVVARKYVITYRCKSLYIIMEEELKKYEEKMELLKKEEQNKSVPKKNIFAKFKSYNTMTTNKSAGAHKTNNIPIPAGLKNLAKEVHSEQTEAEKKHLLKENANRYSCKGRFSGFNILKQIDRKIVDKKYAMSFAEFKKMQKK